ncbi:AMP-binding protein [Pseudomonas aeruginosa]|nr:AMP-binding protein [Pseudomonas aeruginosa]
MQVVPAGRLPPDPRLLDHADARQRSSCVPVRHPPAAPASVARPCFAADQIAYINFSSGTTGRPKAIACTHAGITACAWASRSSRSLRRCASW